MSPQLTAAQSCPGRVLAGRQAGREFWKLEAARRDGIAPKCVHAAVTAEQAVQLVSEQIGVGIISKPHPLALRAKGVVLKPFTDKSLRFETCVVMRKDDDSRLTNQFARSFLRTFTLPAKSGSQMELSLSA
jgi:hypothetical protein